MISSLSSCQTDFMSKLFLFIGNRQGDPAGGPCGQARLARRHTGTPAGQRLDWALAPGLGPAHADAGALGRDLTGLALHYIVC